MLKNLRKYRVKTSPSSISRFLLHILVFFYDRECANCRDYARTQLMAFLKALFLGHKFFGFVFSLTKTTL